MKVITGSLMLALLSAGGSVLHAQDVLPLTLESAIARAQAHNLTALASRAGVAALEGARMATLSGFAPSLSIVETVGRTTDAVGVFGTKLRQERFTEADFALDALNRPDAVTNASTALQLRQPIFNAVAWAQRRAATARVAAGVARDARHRDRLALETCRAYHGLALAQSHLTVVRSGLEAAQSHVRQTQALFEAGTAPLSDVLTARVRESHLREQEITAEYAAATAEDGLRLVMGMDTSPRIVLIDSLRPVGMDVSLETLLMDVEAIRQDLIAHRADITVASRNLRAARAAYLPSANLMAQFETNATNVFGRDGEHWAAFLEVRWDLFSGFARAGRVRQAGAQQQALQHRTDYAIQKARMNLQGAYRAMRAAEARIDVTDAAAVAAEESLRMVELQYDNGLATVTRLLEAEAALTEARGRRLAAVHDVLVGIAEVEFAAGRPVERRAE